MSDAPESFAESEEIAALLATLAPRGRARPPAPERSAASFFGGANWANRELPPETAAVEGEPAPVKRASETAAGRYFALVNWANAKAAPRPEQPATRARVGQAFEVASVIARIKW